MEAETWIVKKLIDLTKLMAPYASDDIGEILEVAEKMNLASIPPKRETKETDFFPPREIPAILDQIAQVVL
ncbi:hypothetical protein ABK046_50635, partial [Streptomyces caeruleatus]